MKNIPIMPNEFHRGALTMVFFGRGGGGGREAVIFAGIAIKLEQEVLIHVILALRRNRRQKTVSVPKYNNKTGPLFLELN